MHFLTIIRAVVVYVMISLLSHDLTQAQQPEVATPRTRQITDAGVIFKAAKNAYFSFAAQVATREDACRRQYDAASCSNIFASAKAREAQLKASYEAADVWFKRLIASVERQIERDISAAAGYKNQVCSLQPPNPTLCRLAHDRHLYFLKELTAVGIISTRAFF